MRNLTLKGIAILTFTIGVVTYLVWSGFILPIAHKPETSNSERIILLASARESHTGNETFEAPKPSDLYMVMAQNIKQPLITEPIPVTHKEPALIEHNCITLTISVDNQRNLRLNRENQGTLNNLGELTAKLRFFFQQRIEGRAYLPGKENRTDLPDIERIPRTVLISPSRSLTMGEMIEIIDALKEIGANPIGLQINDLPS